jgi:uncharacterized protein YraI
LVRTLSRTVVALSLPILLAACGQASVDIQSENLLGADETGVLEGALTGGVAAGTELRTTSNLNLRTSPSMEASVLRTMPAGSRVTAVTGMPKGSWYEVRHNGLTGWSHGGWLRLDAPVVGSAPVASAPVGDARKQMIARAQSGVGFSYWWGHGRWRPEGPTASTRGACTGACPDCSHSGSYGADCSGYIAKIWEVPGWNDELTQDSHPYSTYNFYNEETAWRGISRGALQPGDALVYRSGGAGHIALYESGDAWGSLWLYEARSCGNGIVHNLRGLDGSYKAIRRAGL